VKEDPRTDPAEFISYSHQYGIVDNPDEFISLRENIMKKTCCGEWWSA
jgi:hypothetical protein